MPKEVYLDTKKNYKKNSRIGILSTEATLKTKIYSNYFDKNNNSVSSLADDVCGKRLTSCKARFGENAQLPFGAFPTAGRSQ